MWPSVSRNNRGGQGPGVGETRNAGPTRTRLRRISPCLSASPRAVRPAFRRVARVVTHHQSVDDQMALDRLERAAIARVVGLEESDRRQQQQARVVILRTV